MKTINRKKQNKDIYHNKVVISLLLLLLVEPAYFAQINTIDTIFKIGSLISTIFLLITLFSQKISKTSLWILAFFGTIFFTTILGSSNLLEYMKRYFPLLAACLVFERWIHKSPETLVDAFSILEIWIYVNFITILLFPNGMYQSELYSANWFLGYKNPQIRTILPIICMSLIRSYWKYDKISIRTFLLIIISALSLIMIDSSTSLIGFTIFILLLVIYHKKNKRLPKIFTLKNALLVTIILFLVLVVFQLQEFFSYLIVDILGSDLTFHTRSQLWVMAIDLIKKKWLFGYGYLVARDYQALFGNHLYYTHPHNYFLYIAFTGGIVLLYVLLKAFLKANKALNNSIESIYSKIVLFTLISFLIMGLAEALTDTVLLYPMLILGMEAERLARLKPIRGFNSEGDIICE